MAYVLGFSAVILALGFAVRDFGQVVGERVAADGGGRFVTNAPFVFSSLGPTAFLFFYSPTAGTASPRNAFLGHLIGAAMGWLSLASFGLLDAGPALTAGVSLQRVLAAGMSLGLTSGAMILLRTPHPLAGPTALIVSLGILTVPWQLAVLMLAVVLLTVQAFVINRPPGSRIRCGRLGRRQWRGDGDARSAVSRQPRSPSSRPSLQHRRTSTERKRPAWGIAPSAPPLVSDGSGLGLRIP